MDVNRGCDNLLRTVSIKGSIPICRAYRCFSTRSVEILDFGELGVFGGVGGSRVC